MDGFFRKILGWLSNLSIISGTIVATIGLVVGFIKGSVIFVIFGCVPIIMYYAMTLIIEGFMELAIGLLGSLEFPSMIMELAGMGGWMAVQIKLPQCFAVFMTFLAMRASLNLITFRW